MRVFLAGASGVIGVRLLPLLVADGHTVAGMTRSAGKVGLIEDLGAQAVVCDVFDAQGLEHAVCAFQPDLTFHQLTDLPDDPGQIGEHFGRNNRIRREGTANLVAAALAARCDRFFAQSVAWDLPADGGAAAKALEQQVLDVDGVVLRYGQLYGPDTYYPSARPDPPRIHVDEAARRTAGLLDAPTGVIEVVEGGERGHRALPHTADVILEAWGPDLASCCEEAVAALVGTFVARSKGGVVGERRILLSSEPDESLLLDVLEEVIFTLDTAEGIPVGAHIRPTRDGGLDVTVRLAERTMLEPTGAVPKAVSRSGLRVDVEPGHIFCRFLVDL